MIKKQIRSGEKVYIATDETNATVLEPLMRIGAARWADVHGHLNMGPDTLTFFGDYVGLVEQTICANARRFIGSKCSSFTGGIFNCKSHLSSFRLAIVCGSGNVYSPMSLDSRTDQLAWCLLWPQQCEHNYAQITNRTPLLRCSTLPQPHNHTDSRRRHSFPFLYFFYISSVCSLAQRIDPSHVFTCDITSAILLLYCHKSPEILRRRMPWRPAAGIAHAYRPRYFD